MGMSPVSGRKNIINNYKKKVEDGQNQKCVLESSKNSAKEMPNLTSEVKLLGQGNREIKMVRGVSDVTSLGVTPWPHEFSYFLNSGASEGNFGLREYSIFEVLQHGLLAASVPANKISNSE